MTAILISMEMSEVLCNGEVLKAGDTVRFEGDPKVYYIAGVTPRGFHARSLPTITNFSEPIQPAAPNPKRQALLAQYQRAKMRRDKNAMRDITRQLEKVW